MRKVGKEDSRGRSRVQTVNNDPSETVQSDAHLADINNILRQYGAQGMEMLDETKLQYADISSFTDLADALNQAREAEDEFMKLPSKVREIFDHDVANWLDTSHDQEKRDALVEAGFIKPIEESTKRRRSADNEPEKVIKAAPQSKDGGTGKKEGGQTEKSTA